MKNKLIISTTSALPLAKKVVKELDTDLGPVVLRKFTSGEIYAEYQADISRKDVYVIATTGDNPNDDIMELLLLIDGAKRNFAAKVHVVLPYYPYCRQDKKFSVRSPVSASLLARLIEEAGADSMYSITLHNPAIEGFFKIPFRHDWANDIIRDHLLGKKIKNPVLVAPDEGAAKWVVKLADEMGWEHAILNKIRPKQQQSKILDIVGEVKDKTCVVVDDMVDTASSIMAVKGALLQAGANTDVYVAATHSVLSDEGRGNIIRTRLKKYITTDTIPTSLQNKFKSLKVLSVAPMIASYIIS
ncbi:ribose-phosphate diphosphokinase [Patescibacteria group bacterium]